MSEHGIGGPVVLDSSAVLAWLRSEPGAEVVDQMLAHGIVPAPNWSEICQKLAQRGADTDRVTSRLRIMGLRVEPLGMSDAEAAARLWVSTRNVGLSLADRCCLAVASRLEAPAVTADGAWAQIDRAALGVVVQLIR